jgi:hypothetical protein
VKFTVGQLRETIGISAETFRHWKRVLPPFSARVGRTPAFSLGDLLFAAIINHLTDRCGVRVGHLATVAQKIFDLCSATPWTALDGKLLIVNIGNDDCIIARDATEAASADCALIVCFLTPIITHLRDMLLRDQAPAAQAHLRFPVVEIANEQQAAWRVK